MKPATSQVVIPDRKTAGAAGTPGREPCNVPAKEPHFDVMEGIPSSRHKSAQTIDRVFHAFLGRLTFGLSPASLNLAYVDWLTHLQLAPAKQAELAQKAVRKFLRLFIYACRCQVDKDSPACIEPLPNDRRFANPAWQAWPFNLIYQSFLLNQQWWYKATTGINGVSAHNEHVVSFTARQILDIFSPSNYLTTNPEVIQATLQEWGANLVRGGMNFVEDAERTLGEKRPVGSDKFRVGRDLAVTPGEVIYRNRLIELIQYRPQTDKVWKEPVFIVPAWIMKYYILDLSPHNSLVNYLVSQGHTVFMISWKNPDENDRDLGLLDYLNLGILAALDVISAVTGNSKIHATGYCLGGTLLAIATAAMARDGDDRIAGMTLLAAQTDFEEAGELMLFIDEGQVTFLEDIMWEQGYLDSRQMAGAFHMLRSNDLIWSTLLHDYLLGKRRPLIDLMAWNSDTTRLPYKMHSEYLRKLFLNNDLAEHRFTVGDRPVAISDIRAPVFAVGTTRDHVSPWKSVYRINLTVDTDFTFLLTNGGHNAGIVSEPGHKNRAYQVATRTADEKYTDPDNWVVRTERHEGSWWPAWEHWLAEHSTVKTKPPGTGSTEAGYLPICPAPGSYVLMQ